MATSRERVHILGLGNLGKFFAHSLAKSNPNTPITLLFHRPTLAAEWEEAGRRIEIVTNGVSDRQTGFNVEMIGGAEAKEPGAIRNLIVATKTYATAPALMPLKQRMSSDTTLLFLQNGMGT
jgi:2-dehydropantoate 2-reductase